MLKVLFAARVFDVKIVDDPIDRITFGLFFLCDFALPQFSTLDFAALLFQFR